MGLDQYAFIEIDGKDQEIAYWRKHNRLQGWMENLWLSKGGLAQGGRGEFNCVRLFLTAEDIDDLERAIKNRDLPQTQGFFYGPDSYLRDGNETYPDYENDIAFINKARESLKKGQNVYYTCWW